MQYNQLHPWIGLAAARPKRGGSDANGAVMAALRSIRPIVGLSACRRRLEPHPYHVVGDKYVAAVRDAAEVIPVMVPSDGEAGAQTETVARLDGVVLTGSYSNVDPRRYGGPDGESLRDELRDETSMRLIHAALRDGCPLLGICRGMQEINVALGGSLVQELDDAGGVSHREDPNASFETQYGPSHEVAITPGGVLANLISQPSVMVNSLHSQAVGRLGEAVLVEAVAPDGVVEAISVEAASSFAVAVQWHPEYQALANETSRALFRAFGDACRKRATIRARSGPAPQENGA